VSKKKIADAIRARLETEELTFELGAETAKAGISFLYWPCRCLTAAEFKRGYRITGLATGFIEERTDLTVIVDDQHVPHIVSKTGVN
jgi:hypothetical protein